MSDTGASSQNILAALAACLDEELAALLVGDSSALAVASQRKGELLSRLCESPDLAGGQGAKPGARKGPASTRAIRLLRRMNARNAVALAGPMQFNAARLRFLQSAMGRANLYAADGSIGQPKGFAAAYVQSR
jgi:flagellar biosynthesis/type III secretory pathway chaperone